MDTRKTYFGRDLEAMSFAKNYHDWIMEEFYPFIGDYVAEVGAGTGEISKLICKHPVSKFVGFEPSENMFPLLKTNLEDYKNIDVVNSCFGEACGKYENKFDSIFYINVLEHIQDDKKELEYIRYALKDKGYLLIFVPAIPWLYSRLDGLLGHFKRYRKNELGQMIENAGFDLVKIKYFDIAGIVPWYVVYVLMKRVMTTNNVYQYDRYVVPLMKRLESIVSPPIGKNILLVAKKN